MAGGEVVRWSPIDQRSEKPMYMSKNGRYVHYNDWKKEREQVNLLRKELIRAYLMLEGAVHADINDGRAIILFSLDKGEGELP